MLELVAALMMQEAAWPEGLRAECLLTGDVRRRTVRALAPVCPSDVPDPDGLVAYVEAMLARVRQPVELPSGGRLTGRVELEWTGEAWRLPEPAHFVGVPASYPRRAAQRGLSAQCPAAVEVGADGRPIAIDMTCLPYRRWVQWTGSSAFDRAARASIERSMWLIPLDQDQACTETKVDFWMVGINGDTEPPPRWAGPEAPVCPGPPEGAPTSQSLQDEAECVLTPRGDAVARHGPQALAAVCPGDVPGAPGLQAAAEVALAAIDLDLQPARHDAYQIAGRVVFRREQDGGWEPLPGQAVITRQASFPARAAERGALQMLCAAAIRPDERGAPVAPEVDCLSDVPGAQTLMESEMAEALENARFLPTGYDYCLDNQYHVEASIVAGSRGDQQVIAPGPMPDPARLPNLCVEETE